MPSGLTFCQTWSIPQVHLAHILPDVVHTRGTFGLHSAMRGLAMPQPPYPSHIWPKPQPPASAPAPGRAHGLYTF